MSLHVTPADAVPLFSVIVPAHERAGTIERTVRSVLNAADALMTGVGLEPPGVEVIVIDDGSTDGTSAVVRSLAAADPRVHLVSQPNSGVSAARNAGLRRAQGRNIAFVDADDEVDPEWLGAFAVNLETHDLAFCAGRTQRAGAAPTVWPPRPLGPAFAGVTGAFQPGLFAVRHEVLDAAGGFAVPLRFSENTDLGLRICAVLEARGPVRAAVDPTAHVTIQLPEQTSSNAYSHQVRYESALYVAQANADRLALDPPLHGSYWAIAGVAAARLDRGRDAFTCFIRATRAEPRNRRHLARAAAALIRPLRHRAWPA